MKKSWVLFFTFALAVPSVRAYDAVLRAVQGEVSYRPEGQKDFKPARKGLRLMGNDQVKTAKGAMAQVAFKSGAAVLVKERSRFLLKSDQQGDFISFSRGEFLIGLAHKLKDGRTFRVRTPAAVAAVRGTVFWGLSDDDKSSTYACFTGSIQVTARGNTVVLSPGEKLKVFNGKAPGLAGPANIEPEYVETFALDEGLLGIDQILNKESENKKTEDSSLEAPEEKEEKAPKEPKKEKSDAKSEKKHGGEMNEDDIEQ